jgi:NADH:ubiquinone oxidoreductase subunit 2 (subunit N)
MSLIGIPITGGFFAKFLRIDCRVEIKSGWLGDHLSAE